MGKNLLPKNLRSGGGSVNHHSGGGSGNLPSSYKGGGAPTRKKSKETQSVEVPVWAKKTIKTGSAVGGGFVLLGLGVLAFIASLDWAGTIYIESEVRIKAVLGLIMVFFLGISAFAIGVHVFRIVWYSYDDWMNKGKQELTKSYSAWSLKVLIAYPIVLIFVITLLLQPAFEGKDPIGTAVRPVVNTAASVFDVLTEEEQNYNSEQSVEDGK